MIGGYIENLSVYLIEARRSDGVCVYRKYSNDASEHWMVNKVPPTKCGIVFRSVPVKDDDQKHRQLVHWPYAANYLGREIGKLTGIDQHPEDTRNRQALARLEQSGAIVHAMAGKPGTPHNKRLPRLEKPPAVDPDELQPEYSVAERFPELIEQAAGVGSKMRLPYEEEAPDNWDPAAFARGESQRGIQAPDQFVGAGVTPSLSSPVGDNVAAIDGRENPKATLSERKAGQRPT